MKIKIGTDIIYIPRFKEIFLKNRDHFLENVFLPGETRDERIEHLAGIFAAKEATIKALGLKTGQWQIIQISFKETGQPFLENFPDFTRFDHSISISHDGEYAIAFAIFIPI